MLRKKTSIEEKVTFYIKVHDVVLKKVEKSLEKDPVSVQIERGKHFLYSSEKDVKITSNGDGRVEFNETLNLDATLYQDKGSYTEKVGKLVIRRKKKSIMGSSYVEIGSIQLPLHTWVLEELPLTKTMLMEKCSYPGSQITITVNCSGGGESSQHGSSLASSHGAADKQVRPGFP
ncbi:hypothetical protein EON64_12885 [archaeon]|nr:MAG: hypothetical protein EON64_12885 [archaeon]